MKKNSNSKFILAFVVGFVVLILLFITLSGNNYTVKFNVDGGSLVTSQKIKKGKNAIIPEEPTRENYIFVGWLYNGEPFDFSVPLEGDVVLTANWVAIDDASVKHVVRFDSNGGTTIVNQVMNDGEIVTIPSDPVKSGYKFVGWMLDGNMYDFTLPVTSDITLVAKYDEVASNNKNEHGSAGSNENNDSNKEPEEIVDTTIGVPELFYEKQMAQRSENGIYLIDFGVNNKKYNCNFSTDKVHCDVDGFEIYEKTDDNYVLLGSNTVDGAVAVEVPVGTKKVFIARVYKFNDSNEKVYSSYSKELTIDKTNYSAPELFYEKQMALRAENGIYLIDFGVNNKNYNCNFMSNKVECDVDGFEIYEKTGTSYKLLGSNTVEGAVAVEVPVGTKKSFVGRIYVLDKNKNKVYSAYSKEIVIDKSKYSTPELFYEKQMAQRAENGVYLIDFGVNNKIYNCNFEVNRVECEVDGFELYEKSGSSYKLVGSNTVDGAVAAEVPVGAKKTFVARVFVLDKNKKKIYTSYSKEIVIDKTSYSAPELFSLKGMGLTPDEGIYYIDFGVNNKNYNCSYGDSKAYCDVDGFELYEKTGSSYKLIGSNTVDGAVAANVPVGSKKVFVARIYVLDKDKNKIFSVYSKEMVIDKSFVKAPTLSYQKQMLDGCSEKVCLVDFGVLIKDYYNEEFGVKTVDGFELFEKNGSDYKSLGSNEVGGAVAVEVDVTAKKTYVAKAFIMKSDGKKLYSNYSAEVVISK